MKLDTGNCENSMRAANTSVVNKILKMRGKGRECTGDTFHGRSWSDQKRRVEMRLLDYDCMPADLMLPFNHRRQRRRKWA